MTPSVAGRPGYPARHCRRRGAGHICQRAAID